MSANLSCSTWRPLEIENHSMNGFRFIWCHWQVINIYFGQAIFNLPENARENVLTQCFWPRDFFWQHFWACFKLLARSDSRCQGPRENTGTIYQIASWSISSPEMTSNLASNAYFKFTGGVRSKGSRDWKPPVSTAQTKLSRSWARWNILRTHSMMLLRVCHLVSVNPDRLNVIWR